MGAPPPGTTFGYLVGAVFIFNLVVGTGCLALPSGYNIAGLTSGLFFTLLIFFLAYICVTFVIESQANATAIIELRKKMENPENSEPLTENEISTNIQDKSDNFDFEENEDYKTTSSADGMYSYFEDEGGKTAYIIHQVELGKMSEVFLGNAGRLSFYIILMIYLYGDLAIYAVTIPQSVVKTLTPDGMVFDAFDVPRYVCYWFFLFVFSCAILPFCCSSVSNTKYLQFFTIFCRNLAFILMIGIALYYIGAGEGANPKNVDYFKAKGLPSLWGTVIYCFMCHHSIPGLISPLTKKRKVNLLMFVVYVFILIFYTLLSSTAIFAFGDPSFDPDCSDTIHCQIQSLYTYNFISFPSKVVGYYLGLFPVLTLTSSYALIAITLRNNLMMLVPWGKGASWEHPYRQYIFAMIAAVPSLILASVFTDVDVLVSFTGSYAGLFIEFVIPATLVYYSRKECKRIFVDEPNPYRSPFQHIGWIIFILVVATISLIVVTFNNVYSIYDTIVNFSTSDHSFFNN